MSTDDDKDKALRRVIETAGALYEAAEGVDDETEDLAEAVVDELQEHRAALEAYDNALEESEETSG